MTPDIAPLGVPASADDAAWCAYVDIFNAAYAHDAGTDLLSWDRVDLLSRLQRQEHQEIHAYVARDGGVTIGAASLEFDRSTKNDVEFMVSVDPTHHGRGISSTRRVASVVRSRSTSRRRPSTDPSWTTPT